MKKSQHRLTNHQRWAILILTIVLAVYIYFSGVSSYLVDLMGRFGIIGVLISGAFFGYGFTAAPATASLIAFTDTINPLIVSFIGATGTMIGDLVIFHMFKRGLPDEVEGLIEQTKLKKLKKSKLKWLIPGIAGFIIASPLPDEAGIALLGAAKFDGNTFMLLAFSLNFIGLLVITTIAWWV
jgi:hypothetical protein